MKKYSSEIDELDELLSNLGFSAPPMSPITEEQDQTVEEQDQTVDEKNDFIKSFHDQGKYQWPVQVSLIPEVQPDKLLLKHFKNDQWKPISEEKGPYIIGSFAPGVYLNPTHKSGHDGVDLSAPSGTPIYPIGPGVVWKTTPQETNIGGITVYIEHEDGNVISYYAHMNSVNVTPGQNVDFNTVIGTVGRTGNARNTSPHLHYSVKVDGKLIDPKSIIGKPVGSLSNVKQSSRKNSFEKIANNIKPKLSKKEKSLSKIIDIYLDSPVITGEEIILSLKDKKAEDIGNIVKLLKAKIKKNPNMIKKEAKKIISI